MKRKTVWLFLFCLWLVACTDSVPEPTLTPTQQPTATAMAAAVAITPTATLTASLPPTATFTPVPSFTPTKTPVPTRKPTATATPTITPSPTLAPTATPLPPVLIPVNVSLPTNGAVIQPGNVGQLQEVARLGLGKAIQVEYAPDGSRVAVATPLGVYFYDTATYQQVGFIAAANQLYTIALSPDWQTISLVMQGAKVELRRMLDGQLLYLLPRESDFFDQVRFVADGSQLAIGGERWQVSDGTRLPDANEPATPTSTSEERVFNDVISPDGQTVVVLTNKRIYQMRLSDNAVIQENVHDDAYCQSADSTPMEHFLFSPDGNYLAAGGWGDCLRIWQTSDLQPVYDLYENLRSSQRGVGTMAAPAQFQGPGSWRITDLAFSPDGQTLAAASGYGIVRLWNLQDGTLQSRLATMYNPEIAYSPDGNTLTVWNGLVQFWQPATQSLLTTLENHFEASDIVISPDSQQLLFLNNRYVQQWFIGQNQMRRLFGLTDYGTSLALAPDGQTFATGASDSDVWLWETATGKPIRLLGRNNSAWGVASLLFFPDSQNVVSAAHDDGIHQWDVNVTSETRAFGDMNSDTLTISPVEPILAYDAHCCGFTGVGFVRLGETSPFLELATPGQEIPRSLTFSPDGQLLAVGADTGAGEVWLFNVTTEQLQMTLSTEVERSAFVYSMAFSPDGQILAVASYDQTIRLWRVGDGTLLHTLILPHGYPTTILFSPDGQKLFSCGDDGVIRIWGITS